MLRSQVQQPVMLRFVCFPSSFMTRRVQTPGPQHHCVPGHREPREHARQQLPAAVRPREPIGRLALQQHGRGVGAVVTGAGSEDPQVTAHHLFIFLPSRQRRSGIPEVDFLLTLHTCLTTPQGKYLITLILSRQVLCIYV